MIRIAITGPESSGKTTLSEALAKHFKVNCVPEFARPYLLKKGGAYTIKDLDKIAQGQFNAMVNTPDKDLVFYDTELFVLKVWSEYKYGELSCLISDLLEKQEVDLYLLCKPDLPWEEDPLRENPNDRDKLYEIYLDVLKEKGVKYAIVSGLAEERIEYAIATVKSLINEMKETH